MSRKNNTAQPTSFELSEAEVKRITGFFLTAADDDSQIADFLLLLAAIAYPPVLYAAEDVYLHAKQEAMACSFAANEGLNTVINARYKALRQKGAK